jgi:HAD superfamily hydrolase (TIGR01450 family)
MTSLSAKGSLIEGFDGIVCDLDGVVYRGHEAVPHAVESLLSALSAGILVVYATNNASRAPAEVSAHLAALGLPGPVSRVVTSAQAGARHVAHRCPPGARVLAVGGQGVTLALEEAGLVPVSAQSVSAQSVSAQSVSIQSVSAQSVSSRETRSAQPVVAVLQGYGVEVAWTDLAEVAYAVQAGALWVATNIDSTLPTDRGVAPGNGALVGAVRPAVSVDPVVVGKPHTPLYDLSVSVLGTEVGRTLAIGDRLDTDVMGATAAGMDSLFVFGGVHRWMDVAAADLTARPRYVATDLRSLHVAYAEPVQDLRDLSQWVCGEAKAWVSAPGDLVVSRAGTLNERLRAALKALWHAGDRGCPMDPRGGDGAALSDELDLAVAYRS